MKVTPLSLAKHHELSASGFSDLSTFHTHFLHVLQKLTDIDFIASFNVVNGFVHIECGRRDLPIPGSRQEQT